MTVSRTKGYILWDKYVLWSPFSIWRMTCCRGIKDTGLLQRTQCVQASNAGALNICSRNADGEKWSDLGLGRRADRPADGLHVEHGREQSFPVARVPTERGRAVTNYLSFVKVAYDDIIECLLQLPVGLRVLLACLHDLRCTLLIWPLQREDTQSPGASVSPTAEEWEEALQTPPHPRLCPRCPECQSERWSWPAVSTGSTSPFLWSHTYRLSGHSVGSCVWTVGFSSEFLQDTAPALQNPKEILETLSCSSSTFKRRKTAHRAC